MKILGVHLAKKLYTIGYEGRTLPEFTKALKENQVTKLIDVRQIAWSRKRGFSKTALKTAVEEQGIEYLHFPEVGAPKKLRNELYASWDYPCFFTEYRRHLNSLNGGLTQVVEEATAGSACLMCFEADHHKCHRNALAQRIKSRKSVSVIHL